MSSQSAGIGSALPDQNGSSGLFLTTDGTIATWAAAGGSGVTTIGTFSATGITNGASISGVTLTLGPADGTSPGLLKALATVGSTPANAGASLGTDGTLTLQPADGTHGGVVSTAAQTIAGVKTFTSPPLSTGVIAASASKGASLGITGAGQDGCLAFTWGGAVKAVVTTDETHLVLGAPGATGDIFFRTNGTSGTTMAFLSPASFDMTGLGVGGSIKLKSPDGTTYTLTVANGGTLSIT